MTRAKWPQAAVLLALSATALFSALDVLAEPQLQLYIPGATYYQEGEGDAWQEESWVLDTEGVTGFDVWLLGYGKQGDPVENVRISMAVRPDQVADGSVSVSWADDMPQEHIDYYTGYPDGDPYYPLDWPTPTILPDAGTVTVQGGEPDGDGHAGDFVYGTPQLGDPLDPDSLSDLPLHGVYPTYFTELYMGRLDTTPGTDEIWDAIGVTYEDATSFKPGIIYKLHFEVSGFTCVHLDATTGRSTGSTGPSSPRSHTTATPTSARA